MSNSFATIFTWRVWQRHNHLTSRLPAATSSFNPPRTPSYRLPLSGIRHHSSPVITVRVVRWSHLRLGYSICLMDPSTCGVTLQ
jgi:hypothetical protein